MSHFAVIETEDEVQVGDKTRLSAAKSFIAPLGGSPINAVTITPGRDGDAASVYDADGDQSKWYLDWAFGSFAMDVITGYNDKIDFLQGSTELVATVAQGTYTLAQLATAIQTGMNAAAGLAGSFTIATTSDDELTFTNASAFELDPEGDNKVTSLLPHIGVKSDLASNSGLATTDMVEYGLRKVVASVNVASGVAATKTKYIKVYSELGDRLFATDGDLRAYESDILQWVDDGRASHLNAHREAQKKMLEWLDREGYVDIFRKKYTKHAIRDFSEVREWAVFKALEIIFWKISNKSDDVYLKKHYEYLKKAGTARDRVVLRLDINKDKIADIGEDVDVRHCTLSRR